MTENLKICKSGNREESSRGSDSISNLIYIMRFRDTFLINKKHLSYTQLELNIDVFVLVNYLAIMSRGSKVDNDKLIKAETL